jgi:hypothetical protein
MTACERCQADLDDEHPNRLNFRLFDMTSASLASYEGKFCRECWREFVRFLNGGRVDRAEVTR